MPLNIMCKKLAKFLKEIIMYKENAGRAGLKNARQGKISSDS